jgi:hypothetical protein
MTSDTDAEGVEHTGNAESMTVFKQLPASFATVDGTLRLGDQLHVVTVEGYTTDPRWPAWVDAGLLVTVNTGRTPRRGFCGIRGPAR